MTGKERREIRKRGEWGGMILFSHQSTTHLFFIHSTIKVWDRKTGQLILDLNSGGHTSRIFKLQFNDTAIVSCSQDSRIIVWDFATGGVNVLFFQ